MSSAKMGEDGCFVAILGVIIVLPLSAALHAWAAELNWNWFAVTLGAPRIGFLQAYGISLVVSSFVTHPMGPKDDRSLTDLFVLGLMNTIVRFGLAVGLGAAVHAWMT